MESFKKLLLSNKAWVAGRLQVKKDFFTSMENTQTPDFLWIGCADSRVPAEEVTGTNPGELFVHRNVANQIIHTDPNSQSVVQYAVEVLKVNHIIVCGHYGCGGVQAAMSNQSFGFIDKWLRHIKDVYTKHHIELDAIHDQKLRANRLVEFNVMEQVHNLAQTFFVQKSWHERSAPTIHGWIYNLGTGYLEDKYLVGPKDASIEPVYKYKFE